VPERGSESVSYGKSFHKKIPFRDGGAGQTVSGPTPTVKFEKWISRCEWYSWGSWVFSTENSILDMLLKQLCTVLKATVIFEELIVLLQRLTALLEYLDLFL